MGCGKSKHDVAAGNTISLSKKSKSDDPKDIQKDADTAPEAANTNGTNLPAHKEGESEASAGSGGEKVKGVADVGDVTQETEVRAGGGKDGEAVTNDPTSTKEVDSDANVALAETVKPENAVEDKKEETDKGEAEIAKEANSTKEPESVQTVDESKATGAEGAAAKSAASDGKTN